MLTADELAKHLKKSKKRDHKWTACCPAHNDKNPSLSFEDGTNGIIYYCHAGCSFDDIQKALKSLNITHNKTETGSKTETETFKNTLAFKRQYAYPKLYFYKDQNYKVHFVVERFSKKDQTKTFLPWTAVNGHFETGIKKNLIPYRLCDFHNKKSVIIVEGENCADALYKYGFPATTNIGGSNGWKKEYNPYFKDKDVIIIPDNDISGMRHAATIQQNLLENPSYKAHSVTIANLCENLPEKSDILDWMQHNSLKIKELPTILKNYKNKNETKSKQSLDPVSNKQRQWLKLHDMGYITENNWTIRDLIPGSGLGAAYGQPGTGKTFWALDVAMRIASGIGYQNKVVKHGPTAYIPLESGLRFQNRAVKWAETYNVNTKDIPFFITPDPINFLNEDNSDADDIIKYLKEQEEIYGPLKLIVIDTLSRAIPGGNENTPEAMTGFIQNCDRLWKELNCFCLIIHHTGKDATRGLRGHSSLLGAVDTEISIKTISENVKKATVLKQRDGEEGSVFNFQLNTETIGVDSDGFPLTTCVVELLDNKAVSETESKIKSSSQNYNFQGKHQKTVFKALNNALIDMGETKIPGPHYPTVKCVTKNQLKDYCYNVMTSDEKHRAVHFERALASLVDKEILGFYRDKIWVI